MPILSGHTSPETAYVCEDYPYGFRLRCKIRYWLEYKPGTGYRLVSQTTNPKRPGEVWNKPKPSTYARYGGVMFLNDDGHVSWRGLSEYDQYDASSIYLEHYGHTLSEHGLKVLTAWVNTQKLYEEKLAEGKEYHQASREACQTDEALWVAGEQKGLIRY